MRPRDGCFWLGADEAEPDGDEACGNQADCHDRCGVSAHCQTSSSLNFRWRRVIPKRARYFSSAYHCHVTRVYRMTGLCGAHGPRTPHLGTAPRSVPQTPERSRKIPFLSLPSTLIHWDHRRLRFIVMTWALHGSRCSRQSKQWLVTLSDHQQYRVAELAWATGYRLSVALSADSPQTKIVPKESDRLTIARAADPIGTIRYLGTPGDRRRRAKIPGKASIYFCAERE
jgi:hypothetical protein